MAASDSTGRGLRAVLISTAIAGVLGYVIQLLAPALLRTDAAYVSFSVFWSALYLGVSAMAGVQQEVSRAAHRRDGAPWTATLRTFTLWAAGVLVAAVGVFAIAFGGIVFPAAPARFTVALALGLLGYLATAVLSGVLYGLRLWTAVAFAAIADAVIRAALVVVGLLVGMDVTVLAFLVAVPFGLAAAATWMVFRRSVVGAFRLDVGLRRLANHTASTVVASTASGVMISGLPMLIGVTSSHEPTATVGALLLAITVTRAPIVVPIIALQSFLISAVFRGGQRFQPGRVVRLTGAILAGGLMLAVAAWFLGPPVLGLISGERFEVTPVMAAAIVLSAALVAGMCLTGPALIATRRHRWNMAGWVVAATLTVLALLCGFLGESRVAIALLLPPAVGLLLHALALLRARGGTDSADRPKQSPPPSAD